MEEKGASKACPHCGYREGAAPDSMLHLPPGTILQDKFVLGRVLGQGGFGITYIAWDQKLSLKLAIKEYLPQQLATRTGGEKTVTVFKKSLAEEFNYGMNKFLEEARTLARFNEHPNIVTVRDYFEANGTAYLVMNYHEGVTLQSYLEINGGKIPVEQALTIFMPVLDALKEVHAAGILHRDISPDNVLIDRNGRVILIDFGAARQAMGEKSKSLSVIMKAGYSPEEQYRSRGEQGPWTDIYAVAATMYRAITGQAPLEAIDRMAEDDLQLPSQLGVKIDNPLEETLLKALAIRAKERYHAVEEFQGELIAASKKSQPGESYAGLRPKKPVEPVRAEIKGSEESIKEKAKEGFLAEAVKAPEKKPWAAAEPTGRVPQEAPAYSVKEGTVKVAALVILCGLLIFSAVSFFRIVDDVADSAVTNEEEASQTFDSAIIAGLHADYYIDYENGTIPIGDLTIGTRVVDPSWEWEFRTGSNYTLEAGDETKPVTWIVVAKDHYSELEPHVTLLSEELIGFFPFDDSTAQDQEDAKNVNNHWGQTGTGNATSGLRPWLNSSGIHSGEGFYRAFSEGFKQAVLITNVPNKDWKEGIAYSTSDYVFIPSTTELGDTEHVGTYQIGTNYPYFLGKNCDKRAVGLGGDTKEYWTRSPDSSLTDILYGDLIRHVCSYGCFDYPSIPATSVSLGVRPALNLRSDTLVSKIRK